MKTTVDIPDAILRRLRQRAAAEGTTIRSLIHAALRRFLDGSAGPNKRFRLKDGSFSGRGLAPGIQEGNWHQIRDLAYAGRGGTSELVGGDGPAT